MSRDSKKALEQSLHREIAHLRRDGELFARIYNELTNRATAQQDEFRMTPFHSMAEFSVLHGAAELATRQVQSRIDDLKQQLLELQEPLENNNEPTTSFDA